MSVEITSWAELDAVRNDLTEDYILMADLDADSDGYATYAGPTANDGVGWLPIGDDTDRFTGTFDGNGHVIGDLRINTAAIRVGLFGVVGSGGSVSDVIMADAIMVSTASSNSASGGITGASYGTIDGCTVDVIISSSYRYVGCIAGKTDDAAAVISDCVGTGTLVGGSYMGGITGYNLLAPIDGCHSYADVSSVGASTRIYTGGLVGVNYGGIITNCSAHGAVYGAQYVGGLIGKHAGAAGSVSKCCATGDVEGIAEYYTGGLIGLAETTLNNCYATGDVVGVSCVGGLIGMLWSDEGGEAEKCYSTGTVEADEFYGGLIGLAEKIAASPDSFWDTEESEQATSDDGTGKTTAEMTDIDTFTDLSTEGLGSQLTGTATVGSPMTDITLSDDLSGDIEADDWICLRGGSPEVAEARKVATVTASPPSLTVTEAFTESFVDADIYKVTDSAWDMVLLTSHDGIEATATWFINEEESEYPRLWFEFPDLSNTLTLAPVTCYGTGLVTWAWWQDAVPVDAKRIFLCTLTGTADGLDDLTLPMSSLQYRLYDDGRGYLSIIVPNVDLYSGDIADRINGTLIIYQGVQYSDGTQSFTEMIRATLGDIRYDKGGRSSSLTLTGGGSITFPAHPELDKTITAVTGEFLQTDGSKKIRCLPVFGLYTGDVFLYGGSYYLATYISVMIGGSIAQMEITYTDESVGTLYELWENTNTGVEW